MTTPTVAPSATYQARTLAAVLPGAAALLYAGIQLDGGLLSAALRTTSTVSDDRLSFPLGGNPATTAEAVWTASQLGFLLTLAAFRRRPALATSRLGRTGGLLALVGGVLFAGGHLVDLLYRDALLSDPAGVSAVSLFAVGSVLIAAGFLAAGTAIVRGSTWTGWHRFSPLAIGGWMVVMIPLQFTGLLAVAVAVYALTIATFGLAILVEDQ